MHKSHNKKKNTPIIKDETDTIDDLDKGFEMMKLSDTYDGKEAKSPKKLIYKRIPTTNYILDFNDLNSDQLLTLLKIFHNQFKSDCKFLESSNNVRKQIKEKFAPKLKHNFVNEMIKNELYFTTDSRIWYRAYRLFQFISTNIYPKLVVAEDTKNHKEFVQKAKMKNNVIYFDTVQLCWDSNFGIVCKPESYKSKKFMYMAFSIDANRKPKTYFLNEECTSKMIQQLKRKCLDEDNFGNVKSLLNNCDSYSWCLINQLLNVHEDSTLITANSDIDNEYIEKIQKVVKLINNKPPIKLTIIQLSSGFVRLDPIFYWIRSILDNYNKRNLNFNDLDDMCLKFQNISVDSFILKSLLLRYKLENTDLLGLFNDVCGKTLNLSLK